MLNWPCVDSKSNFGSIPIILRGNQVFDISEKFHTISELLESADPLKALSEIEGRRVGSIDELFANTVAEPDKNKAYFLAPIDLQVIKAAGVTFAASMLERVIEEQAGGDAQKAQSIREVVQGVIGDNLKTIEPGSEKALQLKEYLIEQKCGLNILRWVLVQMPRFLLKPLF